MKGFVITTAGETMLARAAAGETLTITQVAVGKGVVASLEAAKALTALVDQVALGTSSAATAAGSQVSMTVEYRNDMGGGLETGFTLSEFGIFASAGDDAAQLLYYASLGDDAAPVQPISDGLDVHRYPVAIAVTGDVTVTLAYPPGGFVLETRKINDKPLSADVTLTGADIAVSASDATKIAAALSNKAESSYGMLQSVNILDWAKSQSRGGAFSAAPGCTGVPDSAAWYVGTLEVNVGSSQWSLHLINTNTGEAFWNYTIANNWVDWTRIATATPPEEYNLPLAEGVSGTIKYSKDQMGVVRLLGQVEIPSNQSGITNIGTLPEGYYLGYAVASVCCGWPDGGATASPCTVVVNADGTVAVNAFDASLKVFAVNISFC